ncbi:MAG: translation initiation factor IF-1 [Luteolibacter sp.]
MPDATIHTVGKVLLNLSAVLYRVELPNGKIILAHISKPLTVAKAVFSPDDRLILELTPYDFDNARILGLADSE